MSEKTDRIIEEFGYSSGKPKKTQSQISDKVQGRDLFQTPNYATDLLVPFIPKDVKWIWECASGDGKIMNRLQESGYIVLGTDLQYGDAYNFLGNLVPITTIDAIITNPPYSLKYKFIDKALKMDVPFAFLIPFDMCQKMARLFMDYGVEGIVPTKRIDYITPSGLSGATGNTAYYHSFWLTYKFNLGNQLTFVELTKDMKENI